VLQQGHKQTLPLVTTDITVAACTENANSPAGSIVVGACTCNTGYFGDSSSWVVSFSDTLVLVSLSCHKKSVTVYLLAEIHSARVPRHAPPTPTQRLALLPTNVSAILDIMALVASPRTLARYLPRVLNQVSFTLARAPTREIFTHANSRPHLC